MSGVLGTILDETLTSATQFKTQLRGESIGVMIFAYRDGKKVARATTAHASDESVEHAMTIMTHGLDADQMSFATDRGRPATGMTIAVVSRFMAASMTTTTDHKDSLPDHRYFTTLHLAMAMRPVREMIPDSPAITPEMNQALKDQCVADSVRKDGLGITLYVPRAEHGRYRYLRRRKITVIPC